MMRNAVILGAALASALAYAGCNSDDSPAAVSGATGGSSNTGGGTSTGGGTGTGGGTSTGGTTGSGGTTTSATCTTKAGTTDPAKSVSDIPFGKSYFTQGSYKGYCYTFSDKDKTSGAINSTVTPACGTADCFKDGCGMCFAGNLKANSAAVSWAYWGVGVGCSLKQDEGSNTTAGPTTVSGSNINIGVYGDTVPAVQLQVGLNVDTGSLPSGTTEPNFCKRIAMPTNTTTSIPLTDLAQGCWTAGGAAFTTSMQVTALQIQLVTDATEHPFDMCVSTFNIT